MTKDSSDSLQRNIGIRSQHGGQIYLHATNKDFAQFVVLVVPDDILKLLHGEATVAS